MEGYRLLCVIFILFHGLCSSSQEINGTSNRALMEKHAREKRILNIFSVVQFRNSPCQSTMTLVGAIGTTLRNGTCLTSAECAQQSGTASGSCASGFGVCCVFMVSTCGATITRNCSYIKNPGFPTAYTDTTSCTFTIAKCDSSVCDFRLDFDQFTINGPSGTSELNEGDCNTDSLTMTTTSGQATPVICGGNAGQHLYLDAGDSATGTAALNFAFADAGSRIWDIKVTQIPCSANYKRPDGCLQYHTGIDGRLTTFNFDGVVPQHLDAQQYNVCIRQEEGYCCITYTPCATPTPSFALDSANINTLMQAMVDTGCTEDYIRIEEGRCVGSVNGRNTFCGGILSDFNTATANCPIQDCTQPFQVGVFTNAAIDVANGVTVANGNRGDGDNPQQGRSIGDSKTRWPPGKHLGLASFGQSENTTFGLGSNVMDTLGKHLLAGQREHGNDFEAIEAELSEILFGSTEEETIESEEQADEDLGADHDNDDDNGMVKINAKARIPIRKRIGTNKPGGRRRKRPLQDIRPSDVTPIALQPDSDIIDGDRGEFKDYDYKNYDLYAYDEDSQEEEEEEKPTPEEVLSNSNATLTMSPQASEIRASRPFPMGGKRRRNPFGPHLPIGLPGLAPNGKIIRGRNRPYIPLSNSPSLTLGENSKIFPRRRPKFGPKPNGRQQLGRKSNRPNHLAAGPSNTMSDTIENPFKDEMRLNPTLSFLEDKELHELKGTLTSRDRPLPGKGKRDRLPGRNLGPGPLKRKNHNSNNNNIRPSAVKSQRSYQISQSGDCNHYTDDLCLDANNYPSEQILGLLDRNRRIGADLVADVIDQSADNLIDGVTSAQENSYTFTHYFGENRRQDGVEQKHRDFAEEGGFLCPSEIMYAKPKRGKTAQGTWKDIVNVKDYTQTLRMEKCLKPGGGCSYVSHHYKSQCSQVYNYHRLLSWDKERGLHMDIYKVPTCCSCHIMGYSYVYPPLKSSQGGLQKPAFNNQNSNGFSPSIPEFGGPSGGFTESKNVGFVDNSNKDFTAFMNTVSSKFPDDNGPDFGLSEQPSNLRSEAVAPPTNSVSSRTNKPRELSKPPGNTVRRRISSVRRRLDRDRSSITEESEPLKKLSRKPMAHSQPEDEDEFKVRAKEANNFQARADSTESESDDETSKTDESGGETKSVNYGYHPIIDFFDRYRWSAASR